MTTSVLQVLHYVQNIHVGFSGSTKLDSFTVYIAQNAMKIYSTM